MKHFLVLCPLLLLHSSQTICQEDFSSNEAISLLNKSPTNRFLNGTEQDILESFGLSPILIFELNNFLSYNVPIRSYLDLQSILGLSKIEAKQIFDLIFNTNNDPVQYKKTINTVFISSDIDNSSVFKDQLKIRARHITRSENRDLVVLSETDKQEEFIQLKSPYFSDHLSISLRKKLKNGELFVGGYELTIGQGLLLGQRISFGQGSQYFNTEKHEKAINIKTSFGEDNYFTGVGMILNQKNKALFYGSSRLIDGTITTGSTYHIRYGGDHSTTTSIAAKNGLRQYNVGAQVHKNLKIFKLDQSIHGQIITPNQGGMTDKKLWTSSSIIRTHKNFRTFAELVFQYKKKIDHSFLLGLSRSFGKNSGFSFVVQKNTARYSGIYINHLFGYSTNPSTKYYFILERQLSRVINCYFRYESKLEKALNTRFDLGTQIKKRKKWYLNLKASFSQRAESKTLNSSINLKQIMNGNIECRSRLHINKFFEANQKLTNILLAEDFIVNPMQKPYAIKLRLAYYTQENPSNNVFAYENGPIGQYSIKQYDQTGFRYTLNLRWKWAYRSLEIKYSRWINTEADKSFPIEFQYRSVFNSDR